MLLESELVYAGQGYCFALARFAEDSDATTLTAYLERYLPRLDCHYDQHYAVGALLHLDEQRGTDHAARFLGAGGLWERSTMREVGPAEYKLEMDEWCAFADNCMANTVDQWLSQRRPSLYPIRSAHSRLASTQARRPDKPEQITGTRRDPGR
jgi:hypothetical protein